MYLSQQALNLIHQQRVENIQRISRPFPNPFQSKLVQRVRATLRNVIQRTNTTDTLDTTQLSTHNRVAINNQ